MEYSSLRRHVLLTLLITFILFDGCKPVEKLPRKTLTNKSPRFLLEQLKSDKLNFEWFSAKISASTEMENKKVDLTIKIRIRKDSAIWMSVSPALGIEAARILITQDSVKMVNRINSTYVEDGFNYIDNLLNSDFDFELMQSLLTGNARIPDASDDDEGDNNEKRERFKSSVDNDYYMLSNVSRRKRKKLDRKKPENLTVQTLWLDPENFRISKINLSEYPSGRLIEAKYSDFKNAGNQLFPHKLIFRIIAETSVKAEINYSKVTINESLSFPFSIPPKYKKSNR